MSESGGRYRTSNWGMVGAMAVTLVVIFGYVGFRALVRDDLEVEPDSVDYLQRVEGLQHSDLLPVAYPPSLPDGWRATGAGLGEESRATWKLDLLTDDDDYVAVNQTRGDLDTLLHHTIGEGATEGEPVELASKLARTWRSWSDPGGDDALAARVEGTWVVVFGGAGEGDLEELAASLVTRTLRR